MFVCQVYRKQNQNKTNPSKHKAKATPITIIISRVTPRWSFLTRQLHSFLIQVYHEDQVGKNGFLEKVGCKWAGVGV